MLSGVHGREEQIGVGDPKDTATEGITAVWNHGGILLGSACPYYSTNRSGIKSG